MDPLTLGITSGYLASVAASLSKHIFAGVLNKIKRKIEGPECQKAFNECVRLSVVGALSRVSDGLSGDDTEHLEGIYQSFFNNPDVGKEFAGILCGKRPDMEEMNLLFEDAGYDRNTLPGLPFEQAILAFEATFVEAIDQAPLLQPIIQISELRKQSHLQKELLDEMKELVNHIKGIDIEKIIIRAGEIIAQNASGNDSVLHKSVQIRPQAPDNWESFYLKRVIAKCDHLDLSAIEETNLQGPGSGGNSLIKISDVFTTLFLKGVARLPAQSIRDALSGTGGKEFKDSAKTDNDPVPIQAIEAVGAMDRLVILGRPGGGKSTLSNHIVTTLAHIRLGSSKILEKLPGWSEDTPTLPVRIVLREFASWLSEDTKPVTDVGVHEIH